VTGARATRRRAAALAAAAGAACAAGCATSKAPPPERTEEMSPDARAALQTRYHAGGYDAVFAATIAVLQDGGWSLDTVDKPAGFIRASTRRQRAGLGPEDEVTRTPDEQRILASVGPSSPYSWTRWNELVIHIEPWPAGGVRQRIVMNRRGTRPAITNEEIRGVNLFSSPRRILFHHPAEEQFVEARAPEVYADLFDRIAEALRQRSAASAAAPEPPAR